MSDAPVAGVTPFTTSELTVSATGIISVWTSLAATLGDHVITVTAFLTSYSTITITKTFTLTVVDPCTVTSLSWTGSLVDGTFALGALDSSLN